MDGIGNMSDQPEIHVLGKAHECLRWLPTPDYDKHKLVIKCVCGNVFECRYLNYSEDYCWGTYGLNLVDTLDGANVVML